MGQFMKNTLLFKSIKYILKEHVENKKFIFNLAGKNMHQQTLRTSLGIGWVFFRDIIYFSVFILFRLLMSGNSNVEGMSFILFLILGIIPWNFMNECIMGGVMSIKNYKTILSSMKFPTIILPTVEVLAIFFKRMFTLLILLLVLFVFGDIRNINIFLFIYYFISMFVFMCIWNLTFSSLIAISNDFEQLYKSICSVIFYTVPVIWSFENIANYPNIIRIFKLNPIVYIILGFKDACVTGKFPNFEYTIYFWIISFVLFCFGSVLQYKLRHHYIDII